MNIHQSLIAVVCGDLDEFEKILAMPAIDVDGPMVEPPELILRKENVCRVFRSLQNGDHPKELIQHWASFMRRGYCGKLTHPIDIEFDPTAEDQIVEALARLDELGDLIDGTISDEEASKIIDELSC